MEAFLVLVVLAIIAAPIAIVVSLVRLHSRCQKLQHELDRLSARVEQLRPIQTETPIPRTSPATPSSIVQPAAQASPAPPPPPSSPPTTTAPARASAPTPRPIQAPPRLADIAPRVEPVVTRKAEPPASPPSTAEARPSIDWERFMGVKLFAWVGGLALFLGILFFVKHAFEQGLIPPEMRVAMGFLVGLSMVIGGALLSRRDYQVPAQTLCATGILTLYGTTFACRSIYQFAWFGPIPAFLVMALITAAALILALRLEALVVAVLGLVGGFLTPILLSSGQDNPLGLFSYIALLDVGLLALAFHRRWHFLALLAAVGTVLMKLIWVATFFVRESYFEGNKILIALGVFALFPLLFGVGWAWGRRRGEIPLWISASAIFVSAIALAMVPYWIGFPTVGGRPGLLFTYVWVIDVCLLALAWLDRRLVGVEAAAGAAVFLLLAIWTSVRLESEQLYWGLGLVFAFALFHSVLPMVRRRLYPEIARDWWSQLFPLVAVMLMLIPILRIDPAPFGVWLFVLMLNLLVLGLALAWGSMLGLAAAMILTLFVAAFWILKLPATIEHLGSELFVIGAFAVFFIGAGVLVARRLQVTNGGSYPDSMGALKIPDEWHAQAPAWFAVLPFTLLMLVSQRLPLADPSALFALALLIVALLLGLSRGFGLTWLPLIGLGCILALEHAWHVSHFATDRATVPLIWYAVFIAVFSGFPFLCWRRLNNRVLPWAAAALAGPLHFYLVYRLVRTAWPSDYMGLLPVLFAIPSLAGLMFLVRQVPTDAPHRNAILAWFGGATLFFVTLVFPIQFDRQWITVGWALEGAALLWLFHRVPHRGLQYTGCGLLVLVFVRLALNPAVLTYHARGQVPILNWYLYAYGVAIAALFIGGRWLRPGSASGSSPTPIAFERSARATLNVLGTILAFVLLNIQIADYFTEPGARSLIFEFSGNFGRDMTYSIAWAAFALGLLVMGIRKRLPPARYAAVALLSITLLKLFFRDLSQLNQLYRIGAFISVAIIAMCASFLYQRYFIRNTAGLPGVPPTVN